MSSDAEQHQNNPTAYDQRLDQESSVKRNPHPDFAKVQASRPKWSDSSDFLLTQTKVPGWQLGQGANDNGDSLRKDHVEIDPYEEGRPAVFNYKLLISGIVPRPIGFLSTRSEDGSSTNLAPMSYTNVVNHDPPIFTVGFAGGLENAKDTLRNLISSGECCLNIVSEHFLEAANATSINTPYGTSEWPLSGLTPAPCREIKASRVKESIFSVECKLLETKEWESRAVKGKKTGVLAILEGIRFWVREDAINKERNLIDPGVLRAMSRLGGIMYGRTVEGVEIPRPEWGQSKQNAEANGLVKRKSEKQ